MDTNKKKQKTKVLVNVYAPLLTIVKIKFNQACLKRDAYLDKALRIEAKLLNNEIETPNSDRAKNYIVKNFKELPLKPLNLMLSVETVSLINDVCKEKNIPRDSFINRFLLLLTASDSLLKALFEDEGDVLLNASDYCGPEEVFYIRSNIIDTIEEFTSTSALFLLRYGFEEYSSIPLSRYIFKRNSLSSLSDGYEHLKTDNSVGFNVFMSDADIELDKTNQDLGDDQDSLDIEKLIEIYEIEKKQKAEILEKTRKKGESK